jgi:hypothetical protein
VADGRHAAKCVAADWHDKTKRCRAETQIPFPTALPPETEATQSRHAERRPGPPLHFEFVFESIRRFMGMQKA